ncbi:DUF7507 domain-containing protein [Agromyces ramosus]|uniref:Repeat protein (TIGR01451 family) n=1 Tax=Agromyces ramosus TaxID=33879 RepID=A0ABU0R5J2_9MICO|nr:hypothetical protein [Agromyces ramosus]MDQ0893356.1 putative repeat protein (TIGR01451 family) [Agromyces ramosus]
MMTKTPRPEFRDSGTARGRRSSRASTFLAVAAAVLAALVVGPASPVAAEEVPSGTFQSITSGLIINGDLTSTGNGLLSCVTTTPACTALHQGTGTNNTVVMGNVDTDSDPSTFNSTTGTLTIPAGATVAHAWLMWDAMAGACLTTDIVVQATEAEVRANTPVLSVNGAAYQNVGLADYTSMVPIGGPLGSVINAATDVTAELSALGGGAHQITVGNILGSQGGGCSVGWSLHVAYDYGAFVPGNPDSALRAVSTSFGSAVVVGTTRTVTFDGFETNAQGATFLITASDGEAPAGDTTTAVWPGGSDVLPNPTGALNNAFNSFMPGANSFVPAIPDATFHNGNFDTYKTTSANLPVGSTSVDFRFNSPPATDGFFAHSVSMSIPVAQVRVTKLPATGTADGQVTAVGEAPEFRIVINNDSSVELLNAVVTDANAVACTLDGAPLVQTGDDFAVGTVAAGAELTVLCEGPVVAEGDANYTNTASVTATDPQGTPVTDSDTSEVFIPHATLTKSVDQPVVDPGTSVVWTVVVLNDGGTPLRNLVVTDPNCTLGAPTGPGAPDVLAQGDSWTYTCSEPVNSDTTNTATVVADSFATVGNEEVTGSQVTSSDDAVVTVNGPTAHVTLTKTVDIPVAEVGETITWTILVLNDGDQDLRDVVVTDTDCTGTLSDPTGPGVDIGVLAQDDTWTYTCTEPATVDKTNEASVTAVPFRIVDGEEIVGPSVSSEDTADVVVEPTPTQPPASQPPAGALSKTGVDLTPWIATGLLLISAGAMFSLVRRRTIRG